jgi:uncharacterized membrane protein YeaQ/YmgE (transglycosylase-associated protein family)
MKSSEIVRGEAEADGPPHSEKDGLIGDLVLGLVGSVVGGWIFRALGVSAGGGLLPTVFVAFVGAVIVIVAQRKLWHTTRLAT